MKLFSLAFSSALNLATFTDTSTQVSERFPASDKITVPPSQAQRASELDSEAASFYAEIEFTSGAIIGPLPLYKAFHAVLTTLTMDSAWSLNNRSIVHASGGF
jgi:hypothetical protein